MDDAMARVDGAMASAGDAVASAGEAVVGAGEAVASAARHLLPKPKFRGHLHARAFFVSLVLGAVLVALAAPGQATFAAGVFSLCASAMLGVSGLFHRRTWGPRGFSLMRRLDHAMIYLLIAGSYTPFAVLAIEGQTADVLLAVVWCCALVGIALELVIAHAPTWIRTVLCIAMGWSAIIALPQIAEGVGTAGTILLALGGVLYTAGGVIYATHRPDPRPQVFGYHEVFHVLVVIALALHWSAVAVVAVG